VTLRQLLTNPSLRALVVVGEAADAVVDGYGDGPVIDDALEMLRRLTEGHDEALAADATDYLELLLAARRRRLER
jgi:hypothetical protein